MLKIDALNSALEPVDVRNGKKVHDQLLVGGIEDPYLELLKY